MAFTYDFSFCVHIRPAGEDLFDEVGEIVPALPPKQGRLQAPNSRGSTPTLGSIAVPRPPSRKGMEVKQKFKEGKCGPMAFEISQKGFFLQWFLINDESSPRLIDPLLK